MQSKAPRKAVVKVKLIRVFEGTIGDRKYLFDADPHNEKLTSLLEITGKSPMDEADANNMVIVPRRKASKQVVKTLKKTWAIAKLDEENILREHKAVLRAANRKAKK